MIAMMTYLLPPSVAQEVGLNPNKPPSQYILRHWNTEDGLTSESTNDILQTSDGYIWIGTYTGLHRFDGKEFTIYDSHNSGLPSSNVLRLDIDSDGTLWLGTLHGLATFRDGEIRTPPALQIVKDFAIEDMLITSENAIWFSTKSNQLFEYHENRLTSFTEKFNVRNSTILAMEESSDGTIYFGTDDSRLFSYDSQDNFTEYSFDQNVNGVSSIESHDKTVFIGTGKGVYHLADGLVHRMPFLDGTAILYLLYEEENIIWIGTMTGLYRYHGKKKLLEVLNESHGLPNNIIRCLVYDDQRNLWGGTYRNGIFHISDGSISTYAQNTGLHTDIITSVTEIEKDVYLIGNENGKLNLLKNDIVSDYQPAIDLPNARLKHLYTDSKGRIWVSTYAGLFLLDEENSRRYTAQDGFPDNFIRVVYEDSKGNIWVGTKNAGLIRFKTLDEWEVLNIDKGLSSNYIMSITENDAKDLIVGTISGINFLEGTKVKRILDVEDGLPSNFSFSCYPTDNFLWISSNDGLVGYHEDTVLVFRTQTGLPFDIIYDVLPDEEGNLWLPGKEAVLKVNIQDLEKVKDNPRHKIKVEEFDRTQGIKNSHCLGGVLSYKDQSGGFWIPTLSGVVHLKPEEIKKDNLFCNVILQDITVDGVSIDFSNGAKIPANTNRLNFDFTGINYEQVEKLQFRYKLEPFDQNWVLSSSERSATYTNLPPGNYDFQLQAGISDVFFDELLSTSVVIKAAWWQTLWARVLAVIVLIGLGLLVYMFRVRALTSQNKKLEAMVSERTQELENQASELTQALKKLSNAQEQAIQSEKMASLGVLAAGIAHEINNPLNFILGSSHLLNSMFLTDKKTPKLEGFSAEELKTILKDLTMGTERIKKIVFSLNSFSRVDKDGFVNCDLAGIIDNTLTILSHELRDRIAIERNFEEKTIIHGYEGKLHQVFTNLISNAIHAIEGEGKITISVSQGSKNTRVTIKDTGHGLSKDEIKKVFDPFYTTKEVGKGTGLGMTIVFNIVKEHKGDIQIQSEVGSGTEVTVILPNENSPISEELSKVTEQT